MIIPKAGKNNVVLFPEVSISHQTHFFELSNKTKRSWQGEKPKNNHKPPNQKHHSSEYEFNQLVAWLYHVFLIPWKKTDLLIWLIETLLVSWQFRKPKEKGYKYIQKEKEWIGSHPVGFRIALADTRLPVLTHFFNSTGEHQRVQHGACWVPITHLKSKCYFNGQSLEIQNEIKAKIPKCSLKNAHPYW